MKIRLASLLQPDSIVDGEGVRTVIWTQGCSHNCKGCHNPSTHDFKGGFEIDTDELIKELKKIKGQTGITFSGGDPMFQPKPCKIIAEKAQKMGLNVWCYTGFKYENIIDNKDIKEFLKHIDVLVDGKFEEENKSLNVDFRGSTNQRVIDVKKSLELGDVVLVPKYEGKRIVTVSLKKEKNIYI